MAQFSEACEVDAESSERIHSTVAVKPISKGVLALKPSCSLTLVTSAQRLVTLSHDRRTEWLISLEELVTLMIASAKVLIVVSAPVPTLYTSPRARSLRLTSSKQSITSST